MREEIKLSIIVPCYNVEEYIDKCVESLLRIEAKDIEIIFIDDGSTDNTLQHLSNYTDTRINIYKQENAGPSSARNKGIEKAKGQYIMFVDADDYVFSKMIDIIINYLEEDIELLCFQYVRNNASEIKGGETLHRIDASLIANGILNIDETKMKNLMKDNYQFHGPWGKIYQKKVIDKNSVSFPIVLRWGEDICFNLSYLEHIDYVHLIPITGYFYRNNTESLLNTFIPGKSQQMITLVEKVKKYLSTDDLKTSYNYFAVRQYLYLLQEEFCNPNNQEAYHIRREKAWNILIQEKSFFQGINNVLYRKMGIKPAILIFMVKIRCFFILNMLFYYKLRKR